MSGTDSTACPSPATCPGCAACIGVTIPHDHGQPTAIMIKCMPDVETFVEAASTFQQMGDGSRLRILWLLCHCEECVCDIAAAVGMSPAAVSHHLKTLKLHGLLRSRRVGKEMHYTLADNDKARLLHRLMESYFQIECPAKRAERV